jgi:hypothetical protein
MAKDKAEKSAIVSAIVNCVRETSPDGAFVKEEDKNGEWWEVDDSFAREKIGCIFRDILHTQYRSSTKAKQARKKTLENSDGSPASNGKEWNQLKTIATTSTKANSLHRQEDAHHTSSWQGGGRFPAAQHANLQNVMAKFPMPFSMPKHPCSYYSKHDPRPAWTTRAVSPESRFSSPLNNSLLAESTSSTNVQAEIVGSQNKDSQSMLKNPLLVSTLSSPTGDGSGKATILSLLEDALGVVDMDDICGDDLPDDLSDIFDDGALW